MTTLTAPPEVETPGTVRVRPRLNLTGRYLAVRFGYSVIAVMGAVSIVFFMIAASGDPARLMLPQDATEAEVAQLSRVYGFDEPILMRYAKFLGQTLTGQFPDSIRFSVPAMELVLARVPATLWLSGTSLVLGIGLGMLLGYWLSSTKRGRLGELVLRVVVALQAVPPFLMALLLVLVFSLTLRWLPTSGGGTWWHLVLPVATYSINIIPGVARVFRTSLIDTYTSDHVITALAKGTRLRLVRLRHVAVNATAPVMAYIGLQVGGILGGAVVIETVFAYPGVGQLLVNSINAKDFPVTLAAVTLVSIGYVVTSFVVDVLHHRIDPRAKLG